MSGDLTVLRRYAETHAITEHALGSERERDWLDLLILLERAEVVVAARVASAEAENARLRARIEGLADGWIAIPDYRASAYDNGRVDQRHMATEELLAVLDEASP